MVPVTIFFLFLILGLFVVFVLRMGKEPTGAVPRPAPGTDPRPAAGPTGRCPECGEALSGDAPEGLCPRCLLQCALNAPPPASDAGPSTSGFHGAFAAPSVEELAPHFPQLEILSLLGQGGMGAVYKARQTKLDRLVALKILPAEWGKDPAFAERFAREARALARLTHPHVVAVHDFGEAGGHFYLLMEYVDGANLRQLLQEGPLQPAVALQVIPQVCAALQYAHEEGVVHRDVKPENILLDKRGRVKMADFGLAKLVGPSRASFTLTGTHQVMGTLDYMAPEQRSRPQEVDHRADIYSLGVVLYEMLTGELPLGRFAPPSQRARVNGRVDEVVFRALERDPERRYQRISEVKSDVECITHGAAAPGAAAGGADSWPGIADPIWTQFQVRGPAALLMVCGIAALVFWAIMGLVFVFDTVLRHPYYGPPPVAVAGVILFGGLITLALSGTILAGARKLKEFDGYDLVLVAIILAMLPWSPHALLGIPAGIWCFWTLSRPEVRAAFAANLRRSGRPVAPPPPPPPPAPRPGQPTGPIRRKVKSFFRSFRSMFVSRPALTEGTTTEGEPAPAEVPAGAPPRPVAGWLPNPHRGRTGVAGAVREVLGQKVVWVAALGLVLLLFCLVPVGYHTQSLALERQASYNARNYYSGASTKPPSPEQGANSPWPSFVSNPEKPALNGNFISAVQLDPGKVGRAEEILREVCRDYLEVERKQVSTYWDNQSHLHVQVKSFPRDYHRLEQAFWSRLDEVLTNGQRALARQQRRGYRSFFPFGKVEGTLEIWRDNLFEYHWKLWDSQGNRKVLQFGNGNPLPGECERFWQREIRGDANKTGKQ